MGDSLMLTWVPEPQLEKKGETGATGDWELVSFTEITPALREQMKQRLADDWCREAIADACYGGRPAARWVGPDTEPVELTDDEMVEDFLDRLTDWLRSAEWLRDVVWGEIEGTAYYFAGGPESYPGDSFELLSAVANTGLWIEPFEGES